MPRKKKALPNRSDGRYEIKATIGKGYDGTPIRKSFYNTISRDDAKRQADEYKIEMEVANRTGVGFISRDIGFSEWALKWLETYKKPDIDENTYVDTYLNAVNNHLIPYFSNAAIDDIKPIHIKAFYTSKQHMSLSMLSKMRICINGLFEAAIDNSLCARNPARGITYTSSKKQALKQVYTDSEIAFVESQSEKILPEIILLLETGLRKGELLGLKWEDIDLNNCTISVNRSVAHVKGGGVKINQPKWGSTRTNPLSGVAVSLLKNIQRNKYEYVFPTDLGEPQNPNTWSQKLQRFMNTLPDSMPRLSAHELRHTYGTYLRRHGVDIYSIQKNYGARLRYNRTKSEKPYKYGVLAV